MTKRTKASETTGRRDKPCVGNSQSERAFQQQIREYEATNRQGPGDHTSRVLPENHLLGLYSEEFFQIGMQLKRIEKKLDFLVLNKPKD